MTRRQRCLRFKKKDRLKIENLDSVSHETKPPARYTEATLVKALEAEGIGRPSTYATIIDTIIDRDYVIKNGSQLIPTFTAFAVNQLLETYFPKLVDLGFTAKMEQDLDDIANGQGDRLPYLQQFYNGSEGLDAQVKINEEAIDPRSACTLQFDGITSRIRVGKFGPYLETEKNGETVTASIPDSLAPADITNAIVDNLIELKQRGPSPWELIPRRDCQFICSSGRSDRTCSWVKKARMTRSRSEFRCRRLATPARSRSKTRWPICSCLVNSANIPRQDMWSPPGWACTVPT